MPLRAFGAIMPCLVLAWCFVPFGNSTRSGSRWSYDHVVEDRDKLERARAPGRIRKDPERQRLRQAVLNVGSRLEASPCDPSIKPVLVAATAALLTHMRETGDEPRETVTIDGQEVDTAPFLNDSAGDVIREAATGGILHYEDFPPEIAWHFPRTLPAKDSHAWYGGKFACKHGYPVDRDEKRRRIRQAMLDAASRVESSPCDQRLKAPLRAAAAAFIKDRRQDGGPTSDKDEDIIRESAMAGILQSADFLSSGESALFSAAQGLGVKPAQSARSDHSSYRGRFARRNGDD